MFCVRKRQFSTHHRQVLVCTIEVFQLAKTCSEVISCDIFCPHACGVMFVSGRMDSRHEYVRSFDERLKKEKQENINRLQAALYWNANREVAQSTTTTAKRTWPKGRNKQTMGGQVRYNVLHNFLTVFWRNSDLKWPEACIIYKIWSHYGSFSCFLQSWINRRRYTYFSLSKVLDSLLYIDVLIFLMFTNLRKIYSNAGSSCGPHRDADFLLICAIWNSSIGNPLQRHSPGSSDRSGGGNTSSKTRE